MVNVHWLLCDFRDRPLAATELLLDAFLSWRSCKQKQALSKARAAELGTSPEGEKLQSDSGVFLDSYSLQDNQPSKGKLDSDSIAKVQICAKKKKKSKNW